MLVEPFVLEHFEKFDNTDLRVFLADQPWKSFWIIEKMVILEPLNETHLKWFLNLEC